jgi:hypothetical protein
MRGTVRPLEKTDSSRRCEEAVPKGVGLWPKGRLRPRVKPIEEKHSIGARGDGMHAWLAPYKSRPSVRLVAGLLSELGLGFCQYLRAMPPNPSELLGSRERNFAAPLPLNVVGGHSYVPSQTAFLHTAVALEHSAAEPSAGRYKFCSGRISSQGTKRGGGATARQRRPIPG